MNQNSGNQQPSPEDVSQKQRETQLKSAKTLVTVAIVCGPVSIVLGGVVLSAIALVCGILAFVKVRPLVTDADTKGTYIYSIRRQALVAIVVSVLALSLNAISLIILLPDIIAFLQSDEFESLMLSTMEDSEPVAGSSTFG